MVIGGGSDELRYLDYPRTYSSISQVELQLGGELLVIMGLIFDGQSDNIPICQTIIRNFNDFIIDSLTFIQIFDYCI